MVLVIMTSLGQGSANAAYQEQANSMRRSHDENGLIQMNMYSLGVMDLDLSISPVAPADITSLRRRWPKAVFNTLRRWASDVERLCRDAPNRADKAFRYSGPGHSKQAPLSLLWQSWRRR